MRTLLDNKLEIIRNIQQKGFFHLLSANMLIQIVAFSSQLFVAGILAPEDMGRIKIIQTFLTVFSIIAGMGFSASTLKLCSENRSLEEQSAIFQSAFIFTIISTVSTYFIILILNYFNVFTSDKLIQWLIPLGLFPIISNSLFMVFVSFFQANKKIKLLSNLTVTNKLISIVGIMLMTYWLGITGYYLAYNLSFILVLIACLKVIIDVFSINVFSFTGISHFKTHWHYAKSSMLGNVLSVIGAYMDILLLGFFIKDMHSIGLYSFALTLIVVLGLFPSTVQQIAIPYFSALAYQKTEFMVAFKRYNKILYLAVISTLIAAWLMGPLSIKWIFGGKYDASIPYFYLLSIGWSFRQLTQLQSGALFGLGKLNYSVYINLASMIFNIIVFSISLYYFGLKGAAYASIPCGLFTLLLSIYFFKKAKNEMLD